MKTTTNNRTQTNIKLFVAFVLLVLSSTGAFAQTNTASVVATTSTEVSVSNEVKTVIATDKAVASTSMDFAVWFMGSKKTTNDASNGTFSKKQLINSGINTNSVLIRSFLKKVSTQGNAVA
ncbi:hypothetical protein L1S35_07085 [Flavobacterium sp. AS60]|uniref:hypothetical protein n=1 Tax=Flavobacterium anseongense TaxID=2910677 RepID=UPI001F312B61|nr:hypothetical protein [Flavobacterium sp. AS60]MCF6129431.1 hypothetical protein [Flavobacterium sp. AS60]